MPAPPFKLTPHVLSQVAEICGQVGRLDGANWGSRSPHLRKDRRIQSIHSSLAIENNTLSLDQVTAVIDGKKVLGLEREIQEVKNAFRAYEDLGSLQPTSTADFLSAHSTMLSGIKEDAGQFRTQGVGIYRGSQLVHMAPPADRVTHLVDELFSWLKTADIHPLVASTVVHYEIEFIHPFSDGNGRMGRLWQTLILSQWNSNLAYLPVENVIHREQEQYYQALGEADSQADATPFVEFMLSAIISTLRVIQTEKADDRLSSDQVTDQVKALLQQLVKSANAVTAEQLMLGLNLKHRPTFRKNYLRPALDAGWIAMTQPDSPNSPTQRYGLTPEGGKLASRPSS